MHAELNGKPIYYLRFRAQIEDTACLDHIWAVETSNPQNNNWILISSATIENKLKSLRTNVQDGQILYFGKTSKFPRFKLSESKLKRTIKPEKATAFIVGSLEYTPRYFDYLLEDEVAYYILSKDYIRNVCYNQLKTIEKWGSDWFKYIQDNHLFYGSEIKKLDDTVCIRCSSKVAFDLNNILNNTYTNLITDNMLDQFVNKKFDILTKDDVDSICDMLDSNDDAIRGMGLKMLTGFNVQETPLTVRIILGLRNKLKYCNEWNSTGVKQIRESINWQGFGDFPYNTYSFLQSGENYSEYDKNLCRDIVIKRELEYLDIYINRLKESNAFQLFGLNLNYDIS